MELFCEVLVSMSALQVQGQEFDPQWLEMLHNHVESTICIYKQIDRLLKLSQLWRHELKT